eukprot:1427065-Karenia_brevis.AAC.1
MFWNAFHTRRNGCIWAVKRKAEKGLEPDIPPSPNRPCSDRISHMKILPVSTKALSKLYDDEPTLKHTVGNLHSAKILSA